MKYFSAISHFQYPWDNVVTAVWQRYPNPFSSHVLSEDTFYRRIAGPIIHTRRLLTKTNRLPKWGERFIHSRNVSIVEESIVDRNNQTFVTITKNIAFTKVLSVEERCTYESDPADSGRTLVKREAWIDSHIFGFAALLRKFGVERFKHNASNATKGIHFVLEQLFPVAAAAKSHEPTAMQKFSETATEKWKEAKSHAPTIMNQKI